MSLLWGMHQGEVGDADGVGYLEKDLLLNSLEANGIEIEMKTSSRGAMLCIQ